MQINIFSSISSLSLEMNCQSAPCPWQDFWGERGVLWAYECHSSETGEHAAGCPSWGNPNPTSTSPSVTHFKLFHIASSLRYHSAPAIACMTSDDRRAGLSRVLRRLEAQLWQAACRGYVQLLLLPVLTRQRCFINIFTEKAFFLHSQVLCVSRVKKISKKLIVVH